MREQHRGVIMDHIDSPKERNCTNNSLSNYWMMEMLTTLLTRQKSWKPCAKGSRKRRVANPQYNAITRMQMRNSLTLSEEEVQKRIDSGVPYVIRIKLPRNEDIRFEDQVRGWVVVNSATLDDKVLMKSDGMPTYHMANIVDDHMMKITHVIRGEEWLPSATLAHHAI